MQGSTVQAFHSHLGLKINVCVCVCVKRIYELVCESPNIRGCSHLAFFGDAAACSSH